MANRFLGDKQRRWREQSRRFCCGVLAWLGYRLIAWGQGLEDRYSSAPSSPVSQAANRIST